MLAAMSEGSAGEESSQVLVVDDDDSVRVLVRKVLSRFGYTIREAANGLEAIHSITTNPPDIVLLDLTLPDMDGTEVLERLRKTTALPVIVVSARQEEQDRILGLDLGADDYLTKPFSIGELEARVRAVLRRAAGVVEATRRSQVGNLVIDREERVATVGDTRLTLSRREFDLLALLASRPGRVFSREEILNAAWGSRDNWQDPATVTEHVRRLRIKLAEVDHCTCVIESERGVGYRIVAS
jgi:DNA-binding response OmpR family regulator